MSEHLLSPADIEARARAVGISIAEVCRRAKCAETSFHRWKAGRSSINLNTYKAFVDATAPVTAGEGDAG
jgi:hypothetical protein